MPPKPIDIDKVKREGLHVDLEKYAREGFDSVAMDDHYRLKMHGICTQCHPGFFMLRHRIHGGRLNPEQMEKLAETAARFASGYVHLTTRQNVELHSVRIENIPAIFAGYDEVGITTRSACGHTFRNVIGSPCAGTCPSELVDVRPWVEWVSDMVVDQSDYYNHRLPKRLNVSFAGCSSCGSPAQVNDIGLSAVKSASGEIGFSLQVGGSMGVPPKVGWLLREFVSLSDTLLALKAVAELYILHGDRKSPAKGRLKFLIEAWGLDKFREEFEKILASMREAGGGLPPGGVPSPWLEFHPSGGFVLERMPEGVYPQRQKGFYRLPIFVPLGEIHHSHFTKLAQWARQGCHGRVLITKEQNLEFQWVPGQKVAELWDLVSTFGYPSVSAKSILDILACPGTGFCSLAIASSQGAAQNLMRYFQSERIAWDEDLSRLRVHISGCPNSCSLHQGADIGLSGGMFKVGEDQRFAYQLYLGGRLEDSVEIGALAKKAMADEMVVPVLEALFQVFKRDKLEGEGFREFLKRLTVPEVMKGLDEILIQKGLNRVTYNRISASPMEGLRMIPGG